MKRIICVMLVLLLTGCSVSTTGGTVERAIKYCEDKGDLDYIGHFILNVAHCRNGVQERV